MIRLYYMKLDGDCSKEQSLALYQTLPQKRKEAVDRARNEEVAKKRLYTGAFLQHVLSKETGLLEEQLHYEYNQWGKPKLVNAPNVHFNLSHSGEYVVLAVSDHPVGVDVEHKSKQYLSLAKRCFCKEEYEDILSLQDENARRRRFLEYWTMKEAYIKFVGEGMRIPLNSFQFSRGMNGISELEEQELYCGTFFLQEDYCVSVCGMQQEDLCALVSEKMGDTICRVQMTNGVIFCS